MTFALGLAAVYISNGLAIAWSEIPVELPTAESESVFVVFPDNSRVLTQEKNCGKDPRSAKARQECENERLFGNRDMSLYSKYKITCDASKSDNERSVCGNKEIKDQRRIVWRHWREKTPAHLVVNLFNREGHGWDHEEHYFLEPSQDGSWRLAVSYRRLAAFFVDGEETELGVVYGRSVYERVRWRTAVEGAFPYYVRPGTRYLEFSKLAQSPNLAKRTIEF